ncbi:hypothetical protein H6F43_08180 [Leptolyngbya sp. FACHB-36]|uniref:DUF6737 family protein n=1 Tax=Leptolyngbya sp. FACHB-36 TaxID=2692808 RepID=UPI00168000D1|nr:DUF6737 family protein [Leptolyngbya sp. FACHB-36]MBD2020164.1 hypothetical protein [Leptolyngbya sp. FACHB-36]
MQPQIPDSVDIWQLKPWWCQPWSIVLTGTGLILGSWLLIHTVWVTLLVAIPVLIWMNYFVLVYPKLIAQSIAAQLKIEEREDETNL